MEALLGMVFVGVAFILPAKYGEIQDVEELEDDCSNLIVGDECMFLGQVFCSDWVFEHPDEVTKAHLILSTLRLNRVLIDRSTTISLLPKSMLEKFGKGNKDLVRTNVDVIDYNGKSIVAKGVVMLNVCVSTIDPLTMFVVVPLNARYNAFLGHDWMHGVEVIPLCCIKS